MEEEAASPLLPPAGPGPASRNGALARHLKLATHLSWAANWLLLALKIAAFFLSMSKAVLASLADSAGACLTKRRAALACMLRRCVTWHLHRTVATSTPSSPRAGCQCLASRHMNPHSGTRSAADVVARSTPASCLPSIFAVDLASQMVLSVAEHSMKRYNPRFPIGRGKLEALAVICCASIMSVASLEVVQFSALDLYNGWAKGGSATPQRRMGSGVPWSTAGHGCAWMGRLLTKPGRAGRVSARLPS